MTLFWFILIHVVYLEHSSFHFCKGFVIYLYYYLSFVELSSCMLCFYDMKKSSLRSYALVMLRFGFSMQAVQRRLRGPRSIDLLPVAQPPSPTLTVLASFILVSNYSGDPCPPQRRQRHRRRQQLHLLHFK